MAPVGVLRRAPGPQREFAAAVRRGGGACQAAARPLAAPLCHVATLSVSRDPHRPLLEPPPPGPAPRLEWRYSSRGRAKSSHSPPAPHRLPRSRSGLSISQQMGLSQWHTGGPLHARLAGWRAGWLSGADSVQTGCAPPASQHRRQGHATKFATGQSAHESAAPRGATTWECARADSKWMLCRRSCVCVCVFVCARA